VAVVLTAAILSAITPRSREKEGGRESSKKKLVRQTRRKKRERERARGKNNFQMSKLVAAVVS
jgi:hypothetical protein